MNIIIKDDRINKKEYRKKLLVQNGKECNKLVKDLIIKKFKLFQIIYSFKKFYMVIL